MTKPFGLSDAVLDAIELRLIGCDFRPWRYDPDVLGGIVSCARVAVVRSAQHAKRDGALGDTLLRRDVLEGALLLFKPAAKVTADTAQFVSHAPEDVETLLREVKALRTRLAQVEASRETAVLELDALKDELAQTRKALSQVKDCWRNLLRAVSS